MAETVKVGVATVLAACRTRQQKGITRSEAYLVGSGGRGNGVLAGIGRASQAEVLGRRRDGLDKVELKSTIRDATDLGKAVHRS